MTISSIASDLINASGIVTGEVLVQAHVLANRHQVPFGRALVMSGHLGEGDLTSLLQASQMVKQGEITKEMAIPIVKKAIAECLPFFSIVHKIEDERPKRKLAQFLLDTHIMNENALNAIVSQCDENGLTLGRVLVLNETLTVKQLTDAINLLILTRGKCITHACSVRAFKLVWNSDMSLLDALAKCDVEIFDAMPKIGELLCESAVLSETEALIAAEIGLEEDKPIGEILFERGLVPPLVLKAALRLQSMVMTGKINYSQAQELLRQAHEHQVPVEKVLEELGAFKKNIVDFLKRSRKISDKELRSAIENFPMFKEDHARALLANGTINLATLKTAVHCLNLVRNNTASMDQAIMVFHYCLRTGTSVKEARKELTWNSSIADARKMLNAIIEVPKSMAEVPHAIAEVA